MEAYEGIYKNAKIRVEMSLSKINLIINGKVSDTMKRGLKEAFQNYTLQTVIVIDGEELVVVAQIKTQLQVFVQAPEVYVGNTKIPMIQVS